MTTGEDNLIGSEFDYKTVEINEVGFENPIEKTKEESISLSWDPVVTLKVYKNANHILYKQKQELQLEIKVYKKIIKKLLKKQ
jgi:hypothetical protein